MKPFWTWGPLFELAHSVNLHFRRSGSRLFIVYFEFPEILFTDYLVMANIWISNQIKGNKSCTTDTL